jgi:hypothetical protein
MHKLEIKTKRSDMVSRKTRRMALRLKIKRNKKNKAEE